MKEGKSETFCKWQLKICYKTAQNIETSEIHGYLFISVPHCD
jgi:hypothetical protein